MSSVKTGSKYYGLYAYLSRQREAEVRLPFAQIESLIDGQLPPSARRSRAFWSNRSRGALQAQAWMTAAYHVGEVDLEAGWVAFVRARPEYTVQQKDGEVVWDASLIRALRSHLEVNQAGLAEILGVRQQTVSEWETGIYSPTRGRSKHLTLVAERAGFSLASGPHHPESSGTKSSRPR